MTELEVFMAHIADICDGDPANLSIGKARQIVKTINEFLYTTSEELGTINDLKVPFH